MSELVANGWQNAGSTARYLLAYNYVLVLAPVAQVLLVALASARQGARGEREWQTALISGLAAPLSGAGLGRNLRAFGTSSAAIVYLCVAHTLTAPFWILLGPLLGKDFLLSHVIGMVLFVSCAGIISRFSGIRFERAGFEGPPREEGAARTALFEGLRVVSYMSLGLLLGGLIAAWGLSRAAWAPAEVGNGGIETQFVSGVIGVLLGLLGVPPVANMVVATYLWKTGLGQAGIVVYFCAATLAPYRWVLYSRLFGTRGALRLAALLLAASLLAGLGTALIFAVLDVDIRYKLLPEQLWVLGN